MWKILLRKRASHFLTNFWRVESRLLACPFAL